MKNTLYKLSSNINELQKLLHRKHEVICLLNNKDICIAKKIRNKCKFYNAELCFIEFNMNCSLSEFGNRLKPYSIKFILPSDIANIFDIYFKVRTNSDIEVKGIIEHLTKAKFQFIEAPKFRTNKQKTVGIIVGNARFTEALSEMVYSNSQHHKEYTYDEVIRMDFR